MTKDKMQAAFESAYPAARRARNGDEYGGAFGSMFIVWQDAVAACAPAVSEQVDALTDERAAFDSAFLSANGFHTKAELEEEWLKGLSGVMFRAGAVIAATRQAGPVQQPFAYISHDAVRALEKLGKHMIVPKSFVLRAAPSGSTTTPIYLESVAAPVQAAPEGITDTERLNYIAEKSVLGASYCNITSINTIVHLEDFAAGGTRYAIDCMIERKAVAPAPRSAAYDQRSIIIGQAVAHCNGAWPVDLSSGIMFFNGQRITLAEFNERAKLAGYSPRSAS